MRAGLSRTLGLSDKLFVLVDSVLLTGLGRVMMMPSLVLAARVCPAVRPPAACLPLCATGPRPPRDTDVGVSLASCGSALLVCLPHVLAGALVRPR